MVMSDMQSISATGSRAAAKQLFGFIEAFASVRSRVKTNYRDAGKGLDLDEVRQENLPGVVVSSTGRDVLLSVERPNLPTCPVPPSSIKAWIKDGWQDPKLVTPLLIATMQVEYDPVEFMSLPEEQRQDPDGEPRMKTVAFEDDSIRLDEWATWVQKRNTWRTEYSRYFSAYRLYSGLYDWKSILDKEGFQKGCFLCNGFVRSRSGDIEYPLLLQRVYLEMDTSAAQAVVRVRLSEDMVTRIASEVLRQADEDFNFEALGEFGRRIDETGIDLLDKQELCDVVSALASSLSSKCVWRNEYDPEAYNEATSYLFYAKPMLFLTALPNGVKDAVEKIKNLIDAGEEVPDPLRHLLCGYGKEEQLEIPADLDEETVSERIARAGGESTEVLLSLPANRDQLEIARKVAYSDAVLVQGPPGTGKTHTIANLLGDMLARGQRILVTSATDKALSVLRDKLPEVIQPLCVTLLDTRAGSATEDLRRAVEGICATLGQREYELGILSIKEKKQTERREELMRQLSEVRQTLHTVRLQEWEKVSLQGEARTLSEWAKWLHENEAYGSVLPDAVSNETLSLDLNELQELYGTNATLSAEDETEVRGWMPDLKAVPTYETVQEWQLDQAEFDLAEKESPVRSKSLRHHMRFEVNGITVDVNREALDNFKFDSEVIASQCSPWIRSAQIEGMVTEDAGCTSWDLFLKQAEDFIKLATERRQNGDRLSVEIDEGVDCDKLRAAASWYLKNAPDGKISAWRGFFGGEGVKEHRLIINQVRVAGSSPASSVAFQAILSELDWKKQLDAMIRAWDERIGVEQSFRFAKLGSRPEVEMAKFLPPLKEALGWWKNYGSPVRNKVKALGLDVNCFFGAGDLSSNEVWRDAVWFKADTVLLPISQYLQLLRTRTALEQRRQKLMDAFSPPDGCCPAPVVHRLQEYVIQNADKYRQQLDELSRLHKLQETQEKRDLLLAKLGETAPGWAEAIRIRKDGWTQAFVPTQVTAALRWQGISDAIKRYNELDYGQLQHEAEILSRKFREASAELAATRAWLHLKRRLEGQRNLLQSLQGWMATVKKIGKGTGKNAPRLQAQARQQAKDCQSAVPIWVMTTQRALTTLDPREKFDVIIVDEASQSDITALAVLFMGNRIVVVGDDQQVSPMGIGVQSAQIINMQNEYLKGIRNAPIYDEKTSLYDLVKTVSSPVMLREHFRCATEIIEFSNWLSYDGKIKPLRDTSRIPIRPHVVEYSVLGRRTEQDTNIEEARAIVALVQSCIEQPEYAGKTFGVISMFSGKGQGQVELIERMLKEAISPKEFEDRRITVGISANFQGDERDVMFLSLVQSRDNSEKLMRKEGDGIGGSTKKRYNVAVSRARDQLWVVYSFDPDTDLASDDIRRRLLMHVRQPFQNEKKREAIIARTESPFEEAVARDLQARGYKLEPQYSVGCYRLDFVVRDGSHTVALECDGERYHSGAEKIAEDMERQAILERSGWVFVRVRGSEYYRDPKSAIDRICDELAKNGVNPNYGNVSEQQEQSELLDRVKIRASEILQKAGGLNLPIQIDDEVYAVDLRDTATVTRVGEGGDPETSAVSTVSVRKVQVDEVADAKDKDTDSCYLGEDSKGFQPFISREAGQDYEDEAELIEREVSPASKTSESGLMGEDEEVTNPRQITQQQEGKHNAFDFSDVDGQDTDFLGIKEEEEPVTSVEIQSLLEESGTSLLEENDPAEKMPDDSPLAKKGKKAESTVLKISNGREQIKKLTNEPAFEGDSRPEEVPEQSQRRYEMKSEQPLSEEVSLSLSTLKDFNWESLDSEQQQRILEEDAYMFALFEKHGWTIYDNRFSPKGCLWVIAGQEEFDPVNVHLYDKFRLYFRYSSKPGRTRGGKPGWWLCNKTINRGKGKK